MSDEAEPAHLQPALLQTVDIAELERWLTPTRESRIEQVDVDRVSDRPTTAVDERDHRQASTLTESVRRHGVIRPVVLRPTPGGCFELVAGQRRLGAARAAGLASIPAVVRELGAADALVAGLWERLAWRGVSEEERAHLAQLLYASGMHRTAAAHRAGMLPRARGRRPRRSLPPPLARPLGPRGATRGGLVVVASGPRRLAGIAAATAGAMICGALSVAGGGDLRLVAMAAATATLGLGLSVAPPGLPGRRP